MFNSTGGLRAFALLAVIFTAPSFHRAEARAAGVTSATSQSLVRAPQGGGQNHSLSSGPFIKVYCEGSGVSNGGEDCPCGNTVPPGSMTGCLNRTGHGASLTPTGVPSISADTFTLTATGIPIGVSGFFIEGAGSTMGVPFGNGTRCIVGPFVRLTKVSHSSGLDVYPAPNTPPISVQLNLSPGDVTFFQVLYRDLGGPCGTSINATNAVMAVWGT